MLITGASGEQARPFLRDVEVVVVKRSVTRFAAESLHPARACELIRDAPRTFGAAFTFTSGTTHDHRQHERPTSEFRNCFMPPTSGPQALRGRAPVGSRDVVANLDLERGRESGRQFHDVFPCHCAPLSASTPLTPASRQPRNADPVKFA